MTALNAMNVVQNQGDPLGESLILLLQFNEIPRVRRSILSAHLPEVLLLFLLRQSETVEIFFPARNEPGHLILMVLSTENQRGQFLQQRVDRLSGVQLFGPLGEKGVCSDPVACIDGTATASTLGGSKPGTVMFQVGIDLDNVLQAELAHGDNNNNRAVFRNPTRIERNNNMIMIPH